MKKTVTKGLLFLLLLNFLAPLMSIRQVFADDNEQTQTIVENENLSVTSTSVSDGEKITWEFQYKNQPTDTKQRLKFSLTADNQQIAFENQQGWNYSQEWFVQDDFSTSSQGKVKVVTDATVTQVSLKIQADAEVTDEAGGTTVTSDVFSKSIEGPHQLNVPISPKTVETGTKETTSTGETNTTDTEVQADTTETTDTSGTDDTEQTDVIEEQNLVERSNFQSTSLISLFSATTYTGIEPVYTTNTTGNNLGTFPTNSWKPTGQTNVINHQGNKNATNTWDGVTSWNGNPTNKTNSYIEYGGTGANADFAIRKYARETSTPGLYDVYLNVRGNEQKEVEPLDIVLVVDLSGSMVDNSRIRYMREGISDFMTTIIDAGYGNDVNIALVGFSSPGYTTNSKNVSFNTVTNNRSNINNIFGTSPGNYLTPIGGTYTQDGIRRGHALMNSRPSTNNKIMILMTDGVPTFSEEVRSAALINGIPYATATWPEAWNHPLDDPGNTSRISPSYERSGITINNTFTATIGEAIKAKQTSIIHALGIEIRDDGSVLTAAQIAERMKLIASEDINGQSLYEAVTSAAAIKTYLQKQADNMVSYFKTINNGSISDPLGSQFIYATDPVPTSVGTKTATLPTVTKTGNTINTTNLNLGEGEEIQIHYQVRINTEDSNFVPEKWYQINGPTTLTPNGENPNNKVNFGVPSAKAAGVKLNLKKIWEEYDGDTSGRPDNLDFSVTRATMTTNTSWKGYIRLPKENSNTWERTNIEKVASSQGGNETLWLPKFNNQGANFTYSLTELDVPEGYEATKDSAGVWKNTKQFTPLGLEITKVSDQGEVPLKGAVFKLTGTGLPTEGVQLTDNGNGKYVLSDATYKLKLNTTYTLTEVSPPAGHTASTTSWTVIVGADGKVTINNATTGVTIENNTLKYTIKNDFKELEITTEKYAKETNEKLAGAKLTLRKYTDNWGGAGTIVGTANDLLANDPDSTKKLTPGYYSIQETTVPDGYQEDTTLYKFQVDIEGNLKNEAGGKIESTTKPTTDDWYVKDNRFIFAKYNQLRKFEFSILKKDYHTGNKLPGAVFELRKEVNGPVLAELTTDSEGTGKFITKDSNPATPFLLEPGTYLVKEKTAPNGFVVLEETFEVVVATDGTVTVKYGDQSVNSDSVEVTKNSEGNNTIELTIANTPKGQLPSTGGQGRILYFVSATVVLLVIGAIGVFYFYRNRKELN